MAVSVAESVWIGGCIWDCGSSLQSESGFEGEQTDQLAQGILGGSGDKQLANPSVTEYLSKQDANYAGQGSHVLSRGYDFRPD